MQGKNIENIVGRAESTIAEWKPYLSQVNEIINTIAAFANTEGGKVFAGVSKSGKLRGCQIGKGTIENLTNQISQNTDPKVHPKIITKKIEGKEIIIVEVKESSDHLVLAFGRPYKRVGKSTVRMSKDEYERLILEKHKEDLRWDKEICADAKSSDVSPQKLKTFLKKAGLEYRSIKSSLNKLGLAKNKKLLNTAVILFGKHPERLFPNAKLRCAVFRREDTSMVTNMQDYEGDIFYLIEKAED